MSEELQSRHKVAPPSLFKHKSWHPDNHREEAWNNRKRNCRLRRAGQSLSVSDYDLEELRGCLDLGFNFDSPDLNPNLYNTFPALELYDAVNNSLSRSSSSTSLAASGCDSPPPSAVSSASSFFHPDDNPQTKKTRLKHWAKVVACCVRQSRRPNHES